VEYARKTIRAAPLHAAIGGFHLISQDDKQMAWTLDKLRNFGLACFSTRTARESKRCSGRGRSGWIASTPSWRASARPSRSAQASIPGLSRADGSAAGQKAWPAGGSLGVLNALWQVSRPTRRSRSTTRARSSFGAWTAARAAPSESFSPIRRATVAVAAIARPTVRQVGVDRGPGAPAPLLDRRQGHAPAGCRSACRRQ
jgi:hypothetical protein